MQQEWKEGLSYIHSLYKEGLTALLKININKYIEENIVQFVTGSKNVDKDWNHYLNGFQTLQIDRYLEIYQKAYDAGK